MIQRVIAVNKTGCVALLPLILFVNIYKIPWSYIILNTIKYIKLIRTDQMTTSFVDYENICWCINSHWICNLQYGCYVVWQFIHYKKKCWLKNFNTYMGRRWWMTNGSSDDDDDDNDQAMSRFFCWSNGWSQGDCHLMKTISTCSHYATPV